MGVCLSARPLSRRFPRCSALAADPPSALGLVSASGPTLVETGLAAHATSPTQSAPTQSAPTDLGPTDLAPTVPPTVQSPTAQVPTLFIMPPTPRQFCGQLRFRSNGWRHPVELHETSWKVSRRHGERAVAYQCRPIVELRISPMTRVMRGWGPSEWSPCRAR